MDKIYTDTEALDESVRLLIRKINRLCPEALAKMPTEAMDALYLAENRAERIMGGSFAKVEIED